VPCRCVRAEVRTPRLYTYINATVNTDLGVGRHDSNFVAGSTPWTEQHSQAGSSGAQRWRALDRR